MPDACFAEPRLAEIYDQLDPDRSDLDAYRAMVDEFAARSVLDIGCGTGTFACLLADAGVEVVGLDPAGASLAVARRKRGADRVRWVEGDVGALPPLVVDLVTMTGNVAQVFLGDDEWAAVLGAAFLALRPGGRLAFETRDPTREAWRGWTIDQTERKVDLPGVGVVHTWLELVDVSLPLVSFRGHFIFEDEGLSMASDSTLRFRSRSQIEESLARSGFVVEEVRDAPDRPGLEWVFLAVRPEREARP